MVDLYQSHTSRTTCSRHDCRVIAGNEIGIDGGLGIRGRGEIVVDDQLHVGIVLPVIVGSNEVSVDIVDVQHRVH